MSAISSSAVEGPVVPLLSTVFKSILEIFLLCAAGYILAWNGILDKHTVKHLNRLNIALFTPALPFSKVASSLSPAKLRELWVVPIFFAIVTSVSVAVSFVLSWFMRLSRTQRNFAVAASMFMNSNSLPVAVMQSLVVTIPAFRWGDEADPDAAVERALTYLLLYSTLGMILRWSVGYHLLASADPSPPADLNTEETSALKSPGPLTPSEGLMTDVEAQLPPRFWIHRKPNYLARANGSSPDMSAKNLPTTYEYDSFSPCSETQPLSPFTDSVSSTSSTFVCRLWRLCIAFNGFMTAPLWAALASLVVACIPALQLILKEQMHPVSNALSNAGACSIPTTLIVLGAYFYPQDTIETAPTSILFAAEKNQLSIPTPAQAVYPGETRTVLVAVVSRMFLVPIIVLPLVAVCTAFDFQSVFTDPVFVVGMVLLLSSPPALTLAQISQAASGEAFERLVSRTIFWSYCVVTPFAVILYAVVGLRLVNL